MKKIAKLMPKLTAPVCMALAAFSGVSAAQESLGNLENPVANSIESGITVISGWHCDATNIEVYIDEVSQGQAGTGTIRSDTESSCGHSESGFSLLVNYGNYEPGDHTIRVNVDGVKWQERTFETIRSTGEPFTSGLTKEQIVQDFPQRGDVVKLEWVNAKQSFVATAAKQGLINKVKVLENINRVFIGAAKGYQAGLDTSSTSAEYAEFEFATTDSEFVMTKSMDGASDCTYTGNYELKLSGLDTTGTFTCGTSQGSYTGSISVTQEVYLGRFEMTNSGSTTEVTDTHTALLH